MHCILVHLLQQQLGAYTLCMLVVYFFLLLYLTSFLCNSLYTRFVLSLIRSAPFVLALSLCTLSSVLHIFIWIGLTFHENACLVILSCKFSSSSSSSSARGFAHCWCNVPMKISTKLKKWKRKRKQEKKYEQQQKHQPTNHFTHCAKRNKTMRAHEKFHDR